MGKLYLRKLDVNSKRKGHAAENDISLIYVKHLC